MTSQIGHLSKGVQHADPDRTWTEYRNIIEQAITDTPRNAQTAIGPSEVGIPCDKCLIYKLAGVPEARSTALWLPTIGTAVHAWLADVFIAANAGLPAGMVRFLVEQRVKAGSIGGTELTGSADLFDLWAGEVTDWKIVADKTIKSAKANGPSAQYRYQAHLYGRGYAARGATVNRVRIAFLPRNATSLRSAYPWTEPYDERIALEALARAEALAAGIATVGLPAMIADAPPHTGDFSCARYPADADAAPMTPDAFLALG